MKKLLIATLTFCFALGGINAKADEGMWLPMLIKRLNHTDMQKMGLQLSAEEIYSVNKASLKDAIVGLGSPARNFCSGEIISDQGLFLTNHHCGYGVIQENSTLEHDYLTDGFWAMEKGEEIPAGFNVSILHHMEDVTKTVLDGIDYNTPETTRDSLIRIRVKELTKENSDEEKSLSAVIKPFFSGNEYYMFVYTVYKDVRLVGAPPSSIGKFGGDTDNWMWPRQTGDFCLFRIYTDKDNNPAAYSEDNVPFKPKHHLPVSLKGVEENDFAMIWGFPGSTDRYLTSWGVKAATDVEQPERVKIRREKLDIYEKYMNKDQATRIAYAAKHAQVSNYWKYFTGQTKGLKRLKVYEKKKKIEADFASWVAANEKRQGIYGNVLADYAAAYEGLAKTQLFRVYLQEALFGIEAVPSVFGYMALKNQLEQEEPNQAAIDGLTAQLKGGVDDFFKDYNQNVDIDVAAKMMEMMHKNLPQDQLPESFLKMVKKGDYQKAAEKMLSKSMFSNKDKQLAFLEKPSAKKISKDPVYKFFIGFWQLYRGEIEQQLTAPRAKMKIADRLFVDGLRQMNSEKTYYPNANSTLRFTYGDINGYEGADATTYRYYTTLEGVMEKEDPSSHEFVVPEKLKELHKNKDYGQYANKDGEMVVCILSDNDITGGNSGSGLINGKGHLIGTAFDGNWEAMSGDIAFEPELQRTISVDIRYTLFIIDKFAGAGHLVEEMTLIK